MPGGSLTASVRVPRDRGVHVKLVGFRALVSALLVLLGLLVAPMTAAAAPAAPQLTGYPQGAVGSQYAAFSFFATSADSYQCRVFPTGTLEGSRPAFATCTGGTHGTHVVSDLADGAWTFEVRGVDDGTPGARSTRDWVVTSDPVVAWIGEPIGAYDTRYVTATFTAPGATSFQCRLDGGAFSGCGTGQQGTWVSPELANGGHTLEVRANDGGGFGPVATAAFTVAATLPISWEYRPHGSYASGFVTATFSAEGATGFDCRVYRTDPLPATLPSFSSCGSGQQGTWVSPELADGAWRLEVRSEDAKGPAAVESADFTVGRNPTTWVSRPSGTYDSTRYVTATFQAAGASGFDCRVYRTDPLPATLPAYSGCGLGQQGSWVSAELAEGQYRLDVRAEDGTGARPAVSTDFAVAIPLETVWVSRPIGTVAGSAVAATFRADGATRFECRLDAGTWTTCGSEQQGTYAALPAAGTHTLSVRARDGQDVGAEVSTTFTLAPPTGTSLDVAVVNGPAAGSTVASSWAAFSWFAPGAQCYRFALDAEIQADAMCYAPQSYLAAAVSEEFRGLGDGAHTLRVQARSAGGSEGTVTEHSFTVRSGPWPTIWSKPRVAVLPIGAAAFSWSAPGAQCYRFALDAEIQADAMCYAPQSYLAAAVSEEYQGLADGQHMLRIQAQSAGGSLGPVVAASFTVETKAPATTLTARPPAFSKSATAVLEFAADEPSTFECSIDGGSVLPCSSPWTRPNLADGTHRVTVRAIDLFGNPDPTPEEWTWTVDTVAPIIIELTGPTGTVTESDAVLTFLTDEPADRFDRFECRLDGAAEWTSPCPSPRAFDDLADGAHTFEVRGVDRAGNLGPAEPRTWTVLTDPPETQITSQPGERVNVTTAEVTFTSPDTGATFECKLDGAADYTPCTSPWQRSGLGQGDHTLLVRAVLAGVLRDPTPARAAWTVDSIAPTTHITAGPSGTVGAGAAAFEFEADEQPVAFTCTLDGGAAVPCTSPWALNTLGAGTHTFAVAASDQAGNPGLPAVRTWLVDADAPTVTITEAPPELTRSTSVIVGFTVDDPTATVECSRDGGPWTTPCTSPVELTGLANGAHSLQIRAEDPAGNRSATASATWIVDTVAPVVTITGGPSGTVGATDATATFTVDDPGAATSCRIDDGAWASCTSPVTFDDLGHGAHTISVVAKDQAGNEGPIASRSFQVDTAAPLVTITDGPTGTVPATSAAFGFTVDDAQATVQCRLDDGAWTACAVPSVSLSGLSNGPHTLTIRATDAVGNVGTSDPWPWVVDTVEPETTITSAPPSLTNEPAAPFTFASDVDGATFECSLGGPFVACPTPFVPSGLTDGPHTIQVRAVADGLHDESPAEHEWVLDTAAPGLTVTAAPSGTRQPAESGFGFDVDDATATVEYRLDGDRGGAWVRVSASPFTPPGLTDGPHTVELRATDPAGNRTTAYPISWTVDGTPPDIVITSGPSGTVTSRSGAFTFTVDDPGATVECRLDLAWAPCDPAEAWRFDGLADGHHTFEVRATDAAGNRGGEARPFSVDATAPTVRIVGGPVGSTTATAAAFTYTVDDDTATVECRLDTGPWVKDCDQPVSFSGLDEGEHTFAVRATDPNGLYGEDSRTWIVDTTPPAVTITAGPDGTVATDDVAFEFGADEPVDFQCRLGDPADVDDTAWEACDSPWARDNLPLGDHRFQVRAVDRAGLVSDIERRDFTVQIDGSPLLEVEVAAQSSAGAALATTELGDAFRVRAAVPNRGTAASQDTVLTVPLAAGMRIAGTLPAGCTSPDADGPVTCQLGSVAAGDTKTVDLPVRAVLACTVVGDSGDNDNLLGSPGDDVICGGGGADTIRGRGGNDVVWGYGPAGSVATGAQVGYGPGTNTASSPSDATVVVAGPDDGDVITTGDQDDVVHGQGGDDAVVTGAGVDTVDGGEGADTIETNSGDSAVLGGPGDDTVTGGTATDSVEGGPGNDLIRTLAGVDTVDGGDGEDTIETGSEDSTVTGGAGDDAVTGGTAKDTVDGGDGADTIATSSGDDAVKGGPGNDLIRTLAGIDTVEGGDGDDTIETGSEDSTVKGGADDDTITGGTATDSVDGGPGNDLIRTLAGVDTVDGGDGDDTIETSTGDSEVDGGRGDDRITGGSAADTVDGGDGADVVVTSSGDDTVHGGAGNDTIAAGPGANVTRGGPDDDRVTESYGRVYGDAGDDSITGTTAADVIDGGDGNDTIDAGGGDDLTILGGNGTDTIQAGPGHDTVDAGDGDDLVRGGTGNDTLAGGPGHDGIAGEAGTDALHGQAGNDSLDGGDANDQLHGDDGDDALTGGGGADSGRGGPGDDRVSGGPGNDSLAGGTGNDAVDGEGGADTVYGDEGDDSVRGGTEGDPVVSGGGADEGAPDGDDRVSGDSGNDPRVVGGPGNDVVDGGSGHDGLFGNAGNDTLLGGTENDAASGGDGADEIRGGSGTDRVDGNGGDDALYGDDGNDVVNGGDDADTLHGGAGNDTLDGGHWHDTLRGDAGNDTLTGSNGDDTLFGDEGDDDLDGGSGPDQIQGGPGQDIAFGQDGGDTLLGGEGHDYLSGGGENDYLNGQLGRDVVRGGDGRDELDGGGTPLTRTASPNDHWNRLYGDANPPDTGDVCHFGPGLDQQMTNYRDGSCELRDEGVYVPGQGWSNGERGRLDRGRSNLTLFPG
jgi:Ca2+-binding RTX toxin-like protein